MPEVRHFPWSLTICTRNPFAVTPTHALISSTRLSLCQPRIFFSFSDLSQRPVHVPDHPSLTPISWSVQKKHPLVASLLWAPCSLPHSFDRYCVSLAWTVLTGYLLSVYKGSSLHKDCSTHGSLCLCMFCRNLEL